jgi:uncharacterized membrane-anchored protein
MNVRDSGTAAVLSKVPAVTLGFWIIKILATTLGETGGDTVTMTWLGETTANANPNGYLIGTGIFAVTLVVFVFLQIAAKKFHPFLYWLTILASTTAGTTMADFFDRSLGIGYAGGSTALFACVIASLLVWYLAEGTVSVDTVSRPRVEVFYWITITFSQTLGTALGDWTSDALGADDPGYGYLLAALVFLGALAIVAIAYYSTRISRVLLFWAAFILTRPLGATVGDFFDKPLSSGGLNVSRALATAIIAGVMILCILIFPQRAGEHPGVEDRKQPAG